MTTGTPPSVLVALFADSALQVFKRALAVEPDAKIRLHARLGLEKYSGREPRVAWPQGNMSHS